VYIWYPDDCLVRKIVYIWLNIDILRIETVLDYYDFLVYMYNMHLTSGPLLLVQIVHQIFMVDVNVMGIVCNGLD